MVQNLFVELGFQQRQARREFVLFPYESGSWKHSWRGQFRQLPLPGISGHDAIQFREHDEFVASYVRSSAEGDLNDFNSYFGNFGNPIIRGNERSRLNWDSPNRFLFRGEFHAPYRITVSPVLDVRTGFPYSIIDEERTS